MTKTAATPTDRPVAPPARTPPRPSLVRRIVRRTRRELSTRRLVTVRVLDPERVRVAWWPRRGRAYHLDDPAATCQLRGQALRVTVPEPATLARLVACGLLTGEVRRLELRLSEAPEWLLRGVHPPRLGRTAVRFTWQRHDRGLRIQLRWSRPYDTRRALADTLTAVLRARAWDQTSGPVYALDRTAWLAGASSWPQGHLSAGPSRDGRDAAGRPLGPYLAAVTPAHPPKAAPRGLPLVSAIANPYGRRLIGAATRYRLAGDRLWDATGREVARFDPTTAPEAVLAAAPVDKYAVVSVAEVAPGPARALAACGMVLASPDPAVRAALTDLGLVVVDDPATVADLPGYALSVAASRRAIITGDAALRRTALAGDGVLALPAVTAVVSSMRATDVETCLRYLAAQNYPALEVVLGLHGYDVPEATRRQWAELMPFPLRVVAVPGDRPFGAVLGQLSRIADGDLITKVDDDDHYGPHHVTDLVLAWHTTGADLVAKGARFVHFPERDCTIDRAWAAPEIFDVTPAGGTMLLSRATLQRVGGWSHSSKHVDADLLARVRAAGGLVYRTHAMEYVYVRRATGHTFQAAVDELAEQAEHVYPGLPAGIVTPATTPAIKDSA